MSKYIVTLKFFGYLFPKKNYNEKTLVFYPGKGAKKYFLGKKTTALSSRVDHVLNIERNPHFAQVYHNNVDLQ